jgi:2-dehydro-3-deoxyphosphogluconate aldolase/(4S)-4-hydroxy-2-oxoglutarate aldolase
MRSSKELMEYAAVIPVLTIEDVKDAIPLAQALVDGGLNVLEITLRTEVALDVIRQIRENVVGAVVGAGTVLNPNQADQVIDAGAEFIVTPGLSQNLLSHIQEKGMTVLPGVSTASEIMQGLEAGLDCFKFFPAEVSGGIPALKSFLGPFSHVKFCPTGGIKEENLAKYLNLSNVLTVGGTWLVPSGLEGAEKWDEITRLAKSACAIAHANN